jgi:hypothetical protein
MKVSVLMPTRQRAEMARKSIESLGTGVEVLLWIDDDDPQMDEYLKLKEIKGTAADGGPRVGYQNMHLMVNKLAEQATGDWLLLWNDDALMHTPDWTAKLPTPTYKPEVLNIYNSNPEVNLFPLINRAMYEAMGHYSLSAHCDSWVQDIGNELGIHRFIEGVEVEHLRERINDETKNHSQGAYATTSPLHSSDRMKELMQIDIAKIREKMK